MVESRQEGNVGVRSAVAADAVVESLKDAGLAHRLSIDQIQTCLVIPELDVRPVDALCIILCLLDLEDVLVEVVL